VKTIQSIIEAMLFNLLPADLVTHLVTFFKNIIPLAALIFIRIFLLAELGLSRMGSRLSAGYKQFSTIISIPGGLRLGKQT
jgi:hypothetical protein